MVDVPSAPMNEEDVSPDRVDTGLMPRRDSLMEDTMNLKDPEEQDLQVQPIERTSGQIAEEIRIKPGSHSALLEKGENESQGSESVFNKDGLKPTQIPEATLQVQSQLPPAFEGVDHYKKLFSFSKFASCLTLCSAAQS